MKNVLRNAMALTLLLTATSSFAWFGNNNNNWGPWGGNNWGPWNNGWNNGYYGNPYDEWDPRYWMEEMEDFFDDDYYGPYNYNRGPYNYAPYGGYGPYGPPGGYYYPNPGQYPNQNMQAPQQAPQQQAPNNAPEQPAN